MIVYEQHQEQNLVIGHGSTDWRLDLVLKVFSSLDNSMKYYVLANKQNFCELCTRIFILKRFPQAQKIIPLTVFRETSLLSSNYRASEKKETYN